MTLLSLSEIAEEIGSILRGRARLFEQHGYTADRQVMGPSPGAYWPGGPKIVVRHGDDQGREVRYVLRRGHAEEYLRALRDDASARPSPFLIVEK